MLKVFLLFLTTSFSYVFFGCSCACGEPESTEVPETVLQAANDYIIAQTGNEFFNKYITPDFKRTNFVKPNYHLVYRFIMPEKSYVNEVITFTMSEDGKINSEFDVAGIPNCFERSGSCDFNIDEEKAIKIAKDNGLEKGINDWKTGFIWNSEMNMYVWHILSTTAETKAGDEYRGSGHEILIDPNSGSVLSKDEWHIR